MKNDDKISVVIPTYNREKLIVNSVMSVLKQTYKNIEVIVVDDASTDRTESKLKEIKDKRVKYIKLKTNKGACNARNVGIKKATGKYIAFQDSDDIFHSDKLQKQYNNLNLNAADIDFCKVCLHDDSELIFPNIEQEKSIISDKIIDELCMGNFISTQAILMKAEVAQKFLFDKTMPRLQDYDFVMRVMPNIKASYTNEVLVDLYKQNDSISTSDEKLKLATLLMLQKKYNISKKQKDIFNKSCLDTLVNSEKIKYEKLNNQYIKLKGEYDNLDIAYNSIINSKKWKLISKIAKIIGK